MPYIAISRKHRPQAMGAVLSAYLGRSLGWGLVWRLFFLLFLLHVGEDVLDIFVLLELVD